MTCEKLLRLLIREEIGRERKSDEQIDFYPWCAEKDRISIFSNFDGEDFTASVESDSEDTKIKKFKDNEEARHWARKQVDISKRKQFANEK